MGFGKFIKKIAIGAAIGVATWGIGTAIAAGAASVAGTAAGAAGTFSTSGALTAAGTGALKGTVGGGGGGARSSGASASILSDSGGTDTSSSVKDILGKGDPTQAAKVGGKTLFTQDDTKKPPVLEDPTTTFNDWWNDLGGQGKPGEYLKRYVI
jgi:hypothetical protein